MSLFDRFKDKVARPEDPAAILRHADSCLEKGDLRAAIEGYNQALALLTLPADRFQACCNRALAYQRSGDFIGAIPSYDQAAHLSPTFGRVYLERGIAKAVSSTGASGMSDFDKAIALLPDNADRARAYSRRGSAYLEQGERQLAFADFTRAAAAAPDFTPALEARDRLAGGLGAGGAALSPERRAEMAAARLQSGWQSRGSGDVVAALAHFQRAVELSPDDPDALYARGAANRLLRRHAEAISDLDQALALRPRFPAALSERGQAHREAGRPEQALEDFDAALAFDPAFDLALSSKGSVLLEAGRCAEALEYLDLAVRLNPRDAAYYLGRGQAFACLGDPSRARADFEQSLELAPGGRKAEAARDALDLLKGAAAPPGAPSAAHQPAPRRALKHVEIEGTATVAEAVRRIQAEAAYFVVRCDPDGRCASVSVYGAHGLRDRLTEIADSIGPAVLDLTLGEIADLWLPVSLGGGLPGQAITPGPSPPRDAAHFSLLADGDALPGVVQHERDSYYPNLPAALFGPAVAFEREGRPVGPRGARVCPSCAAQFAYYRPVLQDGLLVDYACPQCGASPLIGWVEARMRPGRHSRRGFLGPFERLAGVIERDEQVLGDLGVTHAQIADALERLLECAIAQLADRIDRASVTLSADLLRQQEHGFAGLVEVPMLYSFEELEAQLRAGRLPPGGHSGCTDDHQVFLRVYHSYQHCPWTILERPWSRRRPAMPTRLEQHQGATVTAPVLWQTVPCRPPTGYKYGECDFLLLDRKTGAYVKGPGILVHLVREHHFFEGLESPFRVDPVQLAKALRLA